MRIRIEYGDGTVVYVDHVESLRRVSSLEVKRFGNDPLYHKNVVDLRILDWDDRPSDNSLDKI